MKRLTDRQREVCAMILEVRARTGKPPTYQELAEHFGVTRSTISGIVHSLVNKRALDMEPGIAGSLRPGSRVEELMLCRDTEQD